VALTIPLATGLRFYPDIFTLLCMGICVLLNGNKCFPKDLESDGSQKSLVAGNRRILQYTITCLTQDGLDLEFRPLCPSVIRIDVGCSSSQLALNRACSPFSAACSSRRFFSSGVRFPAFSAAWIWSKTLFSSMADRSVDTLCIFSFDFYSRTENSRFTKHVIFALDIVQPTPKTEDSLI